MCNTLLFALVLLLYVNVILTSKETQPWHDSFNYSKRVQFSGRDKVEFVRRDVGWAYRIASFDML